MSLSSGSRASGWDWARAALLAGNLSWTTFCLGGVRAETRVVSTALTCVLLATYFAERVFRQTGGAEHHRRGWAGSHWAGWLLLPFLAYAATNVVWVTPVRWLGWLDWLNWAQMVAVFWVVLNGLHGKGPRMLVFCTLTVIAVVGAVLAGYQRFVDPDWLMLGRVQAKQFVGRASGPFGSPNSLAAFFLLLVPATAALTFRRGASATARVWWGWVTAAFLFGLLLTISRGAWLGLAVALTVWPLLAATWSWKRRAAAMLTVLVGIAGLSGGAYFASPKVRERVAAFVNDAGERTRPIIWRGAWRLFQEHPALGTGAGSFNVLFERHRPERFRDDPQWAHSDYLNTLSDYGAVGFVLLFGGWGLIVFRATRESGHRAVRLGGDWLQSGTTRAGIGIGLLAFALQMGVDFHFKIPALGMSFATLAALLVAPVGEKRIAVVNAAATRRLAYGLGIAVVAVLAWRVSTLYRAEARRNRARESIDALAEHESPPAAMRETLGRARANLQRAVELAPGHGGAWADLAYATSLLSRVETGRDGELGRDAEHAAERALTCSRGNYEHWIRRGVARDMQGRWFEAGNDFAEAVKLAPANALAWYYQAEHLSRNSITLPLADGSLAFCLRLDPWNAQALALRHRLAIRARPP